MELSVNSYIDSRLVLCTGAGSPDRSLIAALYK